MATILVRRVLQLVPVFFGLSITIFLLIHLIPGDPAQVMLSFRATPAAIASLHRAWHLDSPLPVQYWYFLQRLFVGDLGTSVQYQVPVRDLLASRVEETLLLAFLSMLLSVVIAVPLAALAAVKATRWPDLAIRIVSIFGFAMPSFWIALLLELLLGSKWRILPVAGYGATLPDHLYHLILPAIVVALSVFPLILRTLRAGVIEVLHMEYVRTARAKGLPRRTVLYKHVFRNALIPTVAIVGVNMGFLLGGTVIIETVFGLPGVGALLIGGINERDYPLVQAGALVLALIFVLVNMLTDIVYTFVDPRIRPS